MRANSVQVRDLFESHGVSTIMVVGGCGDYFDVADCVISMESYVPREVTTEARAIAAAVPSGLGDAQGPSSSRFGAPPPRCPVLGELDLVREGRVRVVARGRGQIEVGAGALDIALVEQLVDPSQTRAIAAVIERGAQLAGDGVTLSAVLERLEAEMDSGGLDALRPGWHACDLARPRPLEVAAALNRLRGLRWVQRS